MSLLQNIVTQVLSNAVGQNQSQQPLQGTSGADLGALLGSLTGGANASQAGLGGLLGSVLSQGGAANGGLGGILGNVLGAQQTNKPNLGAGDLGGLLGSVLGGGALGGTKKGGFNKSALLLVLLPVVLGYIQRNGGVSGVLAKFNNSGLGKQAQSWVNIDRDNDGIDAGDIQRLFGDDEINTVCQETGATQGEVCQGIAELFPQVMNDLTPHGDVAADENAANKEISEILASLKTNQAQG